MEHFDIPLWYETVNGGVPVNEELVVEGAHDFVLDLKVEFECFAWVDNTRQLELESDLVCLQVLQVQVHFAVVASVGHFSFSLKINVSFGYDSNRELC